MSPPALLLPRRRVNQILLVKGPNKILLTLADVTFINPSLSNKVSLCLTSPLESNFSLVSGDGLIVAVTFFANYTTNITPWTRLCTEAESGRQQNQWHEERVGPEPRLTSVHHDPGHLWELQRCHLRGDVSLMFDNIPHPSSNIGRTSLI